MQEPPAAIRFTRKRVLLGVSLAALAGAGALWMLGSMLTAVAPRTVALPPDLGAQAVTLPAGPGQTAVGSFMPGRGRGAVLLLHGNHSDRNQMVGRARFLHAQGYAVLLIDLPGQGASTAPAVTFGFNEAHGVRAALAYLRGRAPGQRIGVIGVSLGAAALVLCRDCPPVDAAVLESLYPTIEEAVQDRLRTYLGALGVPLAMPLLWQLPLRLGIRPAQLRPIERVAAMGVPVLIASGSADTYTRLSETERLYTAAAAPKALWVVDGAGHQDLHAFAPAEYERRVGAFLDRYVGAAGGEGGAVAVDAATEAAATP